MLQMRQEKTLRSAKDILRECRNCKFVYILDEPHSQHEGYGYLYCVSPSPESYNEIVSLRWKLQDEEGLPAVLGGSYNNGGATGVQYEY